MKKKKKDEKSVSSKTIKKNEFKMGHKKCMSAINFNNNEKKEDINIKEIKNYKSESSFAKIRINESYSIFCFKPNDIVIIISNNGKYMRALIEKKGGDCLICKVGNINDFGKNE